MAKIVEVEFLYESLALEDERRDLDRTVAVPSSQALWSFNDLPVRSLSSRMRRSALEFSELPPCCRAC